MNRDANIHNNVLALLVVLTLALAAVVVLEAVNQRKNWEPAPSAVDKGGFVVATVLLAAAWSALFAADEWFTRNAHNIAAITMFVFVFLTVALNARNFRRIRSAKTPTVGAVNRYAVVGALMVLSVVVSVAFAHDGWDYSVLFVEACLIGLFGFFWLLQTFELWNEGLREPPPSGGPAADDSTAPDSGGTPRGPVRHHVHHSSAQSR
jgi:heme A synthase